MELSAISAPVPLWLYEIKSSYSTDAKCQELLSKLAVSLGSEPHFALNQGLLRYKGRLWVGSDPIWQQKIIEAFHASPMGDIRGC